MRFLEFNLLPEPQKLNVIWMNGVFIGERNEGFYRYELFQLDDFYAEQQYQLQYNVRLGIRSFKSGDLLEPYLKIIDISTLLYSS